MYAYDVRVVQIITIGFQIPTGYIYKKENK